MAGLYPNITALTWTDAKEVLAHEAHDFTPWLSDNLSLLADTLGLDDIELVQTEWKVESFALDILARGRDADGDVTLVIENQYGATDHRHLGQILTYAAHAAAGGHRVLAVWITEEIRPAHLAAVEFINRVAAADESTFGMVLLRVRFASAPGGWHVHFETEAEPNAFLAASPGGGTGSGTTAIARGEFIEAVVALLDPAVAVSGLKRSGGINRKHGAVIYRLPATLELSKFATARVVCSRDATNVALFIESLPTAQENRAVAKVLEAHAKPMLDTFGLSVDVWFGSAESIKRERVLTRLDLGYQTGTAEEVSHQGAQILNAWVELLTAEPLAGIADRVAALLGEGPISL